MTLESEMERLMSQMHDIAIQPDKFGNIYLHINPAFGEAAVQTAFEMGLAPCCLLDGKAVLPC